MAIIKLSGKWEPQDPELSFMIVNIDNLTFITPGPINTQGDLTLQQLYFHFSGGVNSMGFWVLEADKAVADLIEKGNAS